VTPIPVVAEQP